MPPVLQSPPRRALLQSPVHLLGSNDDDRERAEARRARSLATRRKSAGPPMEEVNNNLFHRDQVLALFHNCVKLASENKINQKNTWDLGLIDHMSEIIRVESDDDAETNFQMASCTLEAGVKIYSARVDSFHSEAYKVLGAINRVGRDDGKENDTSDNVEESDDIKKDEKLSKGRKMSPSSTLAPSFDSLNVKKFDVAFAVDPLYHQTSAQFDEGGAKGLLLSNLGVYGVCKVLFDSSETPGKGMSCDAPHDKLEEIDLSFVRDEIKQMKTRMPMISDISPSLRDIVNHFDKSNQRPPADVVPVETNMEETSVAEDNQPEWEAHDPDNFDCYEHASVTDDEFCVNSNSNDHQVENDGSADCAAQVSDIDDRLIVDFLSLSLGFKSRANAWAGPDHWKYQKAKGPEHVPSSPSETEGPKKVKKQKKQHLDIEFVKSVDKPMVHIFLPPKNPKTLLLPAKRVPVNITLPEDCHYQPEDLVKLFLQPNTLCLKKAAKSSGDPGDRMSTDDPMSSWDDGCFMNDQFDDGNPASDVEDVGDLVSQPRQVSKIEVGYDKSSKQVDIHALKVVLWNNIQGISEKECDASISFKKVIESLSSNSQGFPTKGVSPHLCFICLLHLANEHGLRIRDCGTLDDLDIYVPCSGLVN